MTALRCAAAAMLISAAFPVSASAASLQYYESVEYLLEYFRPVGGGQVHINENREVEVIPGSETVTHEHWGEVIYFQFIHYGISEFGDPWEHILGQTINFEPLAQGATSSGFPHPVHNIQWWTIHGGGAWFGEQPQLRGSITFDMHGNSSQHLVYGFSWNSGNDNAAFSSHPFEVLEGLQVYDSFHFYANSAIYDLHPGYWRIARARKDCYDRSVTTECRTGTPAPVPLPASAWLLLAGLGALGARGFWNRRRTVA